MACGGRVRRGTGRKRLDRDGLPSAGACGLHVLVGAPLARKSLLIGGGVGPLSGCRDFVVTGR